VKDLKAFDPNGVVVEFFFFGYEEQWEINTQG
jgi:hypothetical protein